MADCIDIVDVNVFLVVRYWFSAARTICDLYHVACCGRFRRLIIDMGAKVAWGRSRVQNPAVAGYSGAISLLRMYSVNRIKFGQAHW